MRWIRQWNRREGFKSVNGQSGAGGIRAIGKAALDAHKPRISFSGNLIESSQTPFGTWRLGDKVTVLYNGLTLDIVVRTLTVNGGPGGLTQSGSGLGTFSNVLLPLMQQIGIMNDRIFDLEQVEVA